MPSIFSRAEEQIVDSVAKNIKVTEIRMSIEAYKTLKTEVRPRFPDGRPVDSDFEILKLYDIPIVVSPILKGNETVLIGTTIDKQMKLD